MLSIFGNAACGNPDYTECTSRKMIRDATRGVCE
jgi:hypothetical protein